jgi:hypothetical protein
MAQALAARYGRLLEGFEISYRGVNFRQNSSDEVEENKEGCDAESQSILNLQMRYHGGLFAMLPEVVVNFLQVVVA